MKKINKRKTNKKDVDTKQSTNFLNYKVHFLVKYMYRIFILRTINAIESIALYPYKQIYNLKGYIMSLFCNPFKINLYLTHNFF